MFDLYFKRDVAHIPEVFKDVQQLRSLKRAPWTRPSTPQEYNEYNEPPLSEVAVQS